MIARRMLGTMAGVAATVVTIMAIEWVGHRVTGAPADPAQATLPMLLLVLVAWVLGTAVGAFAGVKLAHWAGAAWFAAGLVLFGVVATTLTIPTPWWVTVLGIVLPLLIARLVTRRSAGAAQRVAL